MSRWKGVLEFIAVVEAGSFSRAADNLGMAVSQVSKRVSELESRLGVTLLHRSTRQLKVNDAGDAYYKASKRILEELDALEESLTEELNLKGRIKLCSVGGSRPAFMIDVLVNFIKKHPELRMELQFADSVPNLLENNIDLVFVVGDVEGMTGRFARLAWVDYALIAAPCIVQEFGEPQDPVDLARLPCVINDSDTWRLGNGEKTVSVKVNGRWKCADMPACIDACISGMGVFMAPSYNVDSLLESAKLQRLLTGWTIRKPIYAMLPDFGTISHKVIKLMQYLEACLGVENEQRQELIAMLRQPNAEHIAMLEEIHATLKRENVTAHTSS